MMTTKQAAGLFESKPNPDTVRYWRRVGILVKGARIKLAGTREGGRYLFTEQAVRDFKEAVNQ